MDVILAEYPHLANHNINGDGNTIVLKDKDIMKRSIDFMNKVKEKMDIHFDHSAPYFVISKTYRYIEGYRKIRERGIKIKPITEILKDNLSDCKTLKDIVDELRHLEKVKGGIAVSEDQYMAATASLLQKDRYLKFYE